MTPGLRVVEISSFSALPDSRELLHIADNRNRDAQDDASQESARDKIEQVLNTLNERERNILKMRFGFGQPGNAGCTLEECGRVFGIGKERIRELEQRALRKLRRPKLKRVLESAMDEPT